MSTQGVTIEVPVPYEMEFARASGSGTKRVRVCEIVPVNVASVEAPVAISADFSDGETVVRWHAHDDALWRPMFQHNHIHSKAIDLEGFRARVSARADSRWVDDPFASLADFGKGALKSREEPMRAGRRRLLFDGREAAVERVRALAADVILVDGVPMRKAPEPVWTVGMFQIYSIANGMVRLVAPDLEGDALSPFTFPFDAFDEAKAFAVAASGEIAPREWTPVCEDWAIEASLHAKGPDPHECDRTTWRSFLDSAFALQFGRMPASLLPLIGEAQASFDSKDPKRLSDALEAFEGKLGPLTALGYRGGELLLRIRRTYLEARRQLDEDDAYALSTVI